MIDHNDIIKAYEETGIKPCIGQTYKRNEDGSISACAIGVYYTWMSGKKPVFFDDEFGEVYVDIHEEAHEYLESIISELSGHSGVFGVGFDQAMYHSGIPDDSYFSSAPGSYQRGYEIGLAVKGWLKSRSTEQVELAKV